MAEEKTDGLISSPKGKHKHTCSGFELKSDFISNNNHHYAKQAPPSTFCVLQQNTKKALKYFFDYIFMRKDIYKKRKFDCQSYS